MLLRACSASQPALHIHVNVQNRYNYSEFELCRSVCVCLLGTFEDVMFYLNGSKCYNKADINLSTFKLYDPNQFVVSVCALIFFRTSFLSI